MVKLATLSTLEELEREMARAGRAREEAALKEAVGALSRPPRGFLTVGQAAERLGISILSVKRWIERGTLDGGPVEGRWLVATESVERILRVRKILREMDEEGNPTDEEIRELYERSRS
jgi:excisionase family DNA binding protein